VGVIGECPAWTRCGESPKHFAVLASWHLG